MPDLRFFLLLTLVVTAVSCSDSAPEPYQAPPDAGTDHGLEISEDETALTNQCTGDEDCDDGLFCTGFERCITGRCVSAAPSCQDGVVCTQDTCLEQEQTCTFTPQDALCDPGQICDPKFGCLDQSPLDDPLEEDVYEPDLADQGAEPEDLEPEEDLPPDTSDLVDMTGTTDVALDLPQTSDLSNDFEEEPNSPDAALDLTVDAPDSMDLDELELIGDEPDITEDEPPECLQDQECDDGLFCNGSELCIQESCVPGTSPVLEDDIPCTRDTCDEELDRVLHAPINALCDNGLFCDGDEICDAFIGCLPGSPPTTDDGVSCTEDHCDEDQDIITHTALDTLCASDDSCQLSRCDQEQGCVQEPILACLPADLCCAPGCNANNDNDCEPLCGNGELEQAEACDLGSTCRDGGRCLDCQCVQSCEDGRDNDSDGDVDCDDLDCAGDVACPMVIPFAALQTEQGGIAAWNMVENSELGHRLPTSVNQCGSPYTYRFLASPDEPGDAQTGPINPGSSGAAVALHPARGIWHLREALLAHGYTLADIHLGFGRMDLGSDVQGEDWWLEGSIETRRYRGGLIWFSLAGQRILEAPMPELLLRVDYRHARTCGDEVIEAHSAPLQAQEWTHRAEPSSPAYLVATAWLQDLALVLPVHLTAQALEPATQFDFYSQGRTGAYYETDTLHLQSIIP